jgi:hypothetical protein
MRCYRVVISSVTFQPQRVQLLFFHLQAFRVASLAEPDRRLQFLSIVLSVARRAPAFDQGTLSDS